MRTVELMGRPKQFDPETAVNEAMEVFWRKGYSATTPQDLVDALGIGKGSLYNAFGSKQELFWRALRRYRESQTAALVDALEKPGPVRARLRSALLGIVEMDTADPTHRGCMAVNTAAELADTDQEATALVRRMLDTIEDAFRMVIEEGQRTGEIASDRDSAAIGSMLTNTVAGMRVVARVADGPHRLERVVDATIEAL